jgi:LacI family transcriptional regulator
MNDQEQSKAPTIQDVARRAGVAVGTVSRVLNESPKVKPVTRQRVLAAIHTLDYSPNLIARSMTSRRTGSVGVIVPFFTRPFFSEVLQGVEVMISNVGREFVLYNAQSNEQCDAYFRKLPRQRRVDGLLIISLFPDDATVTRFLSAKLPIVLVDAYHPQLTSLVVNNEDGAYQAVHYLTELGHRRIGFINGVPESDFRFNSSDDRLSGFCHALADAGIDQEPGLILTEEWDRHGGRRAAIQMLTRPERPTAIFAASDLQAVGVLEAARMLNIAIPNELSLIGFDGIELAEILELSTVQQPMKRMGELGAQKLIERIESSSNNMPPPERIQLQATLVTRHTTSVAPRR